MRFPSLWSLVVLCALLAPVILPGAAAQSPVSRPAAADPGLGLQMSLVTSGYKFSAAPELAIPGGSMRNQPRVRDSFTASAALTNFSNHAVPFTFPDPVSAARHFKFRVFDAAGTKVWESDGGEVVPQVETVTALPKKSRWKWVARVPLKVDGAWLAPGRYTVEASIAGQPTLGATALFDVAWPTLGDQTGIAGQVRQDHGMFVRLDGSVIAPTALPYGVKARVTIWEQREPSASDNRPLFSWSGLTDDEGRFRVPTPPRKFSVSALRADGTQSGFPGVKNLSLPVTVTAGQFTTHDITLTGNVTYERPRADTGIQGTVFTGEGSSRVPLAGARVRIKNAPAQDGWVSLFLYRVDWEGTTDASGRFLLNTPVGRFHVAVARPGPSDADFVPVTSALVTVRDREIASVELELPATLPPPTTSARLVMSIDNARGLPLGAGDILRLEAIGRVSSSGWGNPQLRPRPSLDPAVLEFDFVAELPDAGGVILPVISPVSASLHISYPPSVSTIRIHSAEGSVALFRIVLLGSPAGTWQAR